MDPLTRRVAARFAAQVQAGEGDDEKSLAGAKQFLDHLVSLAEKAKHELASKKEPGSAMSSFVGHMKGYQHEAWYEHWYR